MQTDETIHIRRMLESDIPSIISLDEKISGLSRLDMWDSIINYYLRRPESSCFVAEIQEGVIGFMIGTIHPWLFGVENSGWIEMLGVDPSHTAKGVGKMLGSKLLEDFKVHDVKTVYTSVEWLSTDLLEFFKTLGMTKSNFITLTKEL